MSKTHIIVPPTGDGRPCLCSSGPRLKNGSIRMHNHGEFRHLLPRFRHNLREPSGLVGEAPSRVPLDGHLIAQREAA